MEQQGTKLPDIKSHNPRSNQVIPMNTDIIHSSSAKEHIE
jgi:hypothetical protein